MLTDLKDKAMKCAVILLLLVVIGGGLVVAYPQYRQSLALREKDAELQSRIDEKKREIAGLIENQRRFRTDADFVESIARQNRRVFPGELVFVFEGD